jgi:fucose permease
MPLSQAGTVLTAFFAGGLIAAIPSGHLMDRFGRRPLLLAGTLAHAAGCLALGFASNWGEALAAGLLLGVGDSTLVVGYHVLLAELFPAAEGAALSRLNVYFGVGALIGPAVAALSLFIVGDARLLLSLVAAAQLGLIGLLWTGTYPARASTPHVSIRPALRGIRERPIIWALALLLTVYVALEAGTGEWAYTYLHKLGGLSVTSASFATSAFWLALTAGRAICPFALRRLHESQVLLISGALCVVASAALVAVADWAPAGAVCIVLLGLGYGPMWPLTFALATRTFQEGAGALSGILTTGGAIGGLVGPWLQGILLLQNGVHAGMAFTLVCSILVAVLAGLSIRASRAPRPLPSPNP